MTTTPESLPYTNVSSCLHILILDDVGTPSVEHKNTTYTDFIHQQHGDNVKILLITSKGAVSEQDKIQCLEWHELEPYPTRNGLLEVLAQTLHQRHRIDRVYTKQEELIIRAAHLRKLLNIEQAESLYPEDAIPFREKYEMRRRADDGGFPSPKFKRILSPCDIVSFIQCYDYPVIVKPTLGCASAGVHVLRNQADRDSYLEHGFYSSLNDLDGELDHNGDLIIETFVDGEMFHVNGYSKRGQIESVWPFKYLKTNLDFTMGESYGNAIIPRSDITLWQGLLDSAKHILKIFPTPSDLFFHMELFQLKDRSKKSLSRLTNIPEKLDEDKPIFILCEIAARRPGGSIGMLIDSFELKQNPRWPSFPEYEFRVNVGLVPTVEPCALTRPNSIFCSTTSTKHTPVIADLMIPLKIGKLVSLPVLPEEGDANTVRQDVDTGHSMSKVGSFCTLFTNGVNISSSVAEIVPISDCALVKSSVEYFPLAKPNTIYHGYNINTINTCARFVCYSSDGGEHEARQFLSYAQKWFNSKTVYDVMPSDAPPVQNSGNSHKPNIAALVSSTKPAQPQQQEQQQPGQRSGLIISTSSITPINQLMPSPAIKRKDSRRLIMEDKGLQKKIESNKDLKSHNIDVSSNGVTSITSTPPYPHPQPQTNSKS